jgi:ATPase subunit of ABC transporter with duplicated ATPase domains
MLFFNLDSHSPSYTRTHTCTCTHSNTLLTSSFLLCTALLRIENVTFGWTPDNILLKDVNLMLDLDSRVGIFGMNGVGKSTLIKLVLDEIKPLRWVHL